MSFVIIKGKSNRDVLLDFFNSKNNHVYSCLELFGLLDCFSSVQALNFCLNKLVKDGFLSKKCVKINKDSRVFYFRRVKE